MDRWPHGHLHVLCTCLSTTLLGHTDAFPLSLDLLVDLDTGGRMESRLDVLVHDELRTDKASRHD